MDKEGCDNIIPRKFDGKFVNIQRRRFCFTCSPFGCKNTKDLNKPPVEKPLTSYESVLLCCRCHMEVHDGMIDLK